MILSIGEILADMVGTKNDSGFSFQSFCGGAPFNVAVNAKKQNAKVGFIGCVGKDVIGKFLLEESKKAHLDDLDIQEDDKRNTTLAFVSLTNGERDFTFHRYQTADYHIRFDKIDFSKYSDLKIIHLGSLMLSERHGRVLAKKVTKKSKALGALLSFDVNFRSDTYKDFNQAKSSYKYFIKNADIIKFSEEELRNYSGFDTIKEGIESIYRKNQLFLVTLGAQGSMYYYNGDMEIVPTEKLKPVDTTGAGDAFFGAFLAKIEGKAWTKKNIRNAITEANLQGALATQFMGAIKLS